MKQGVKMCLLFWVSAAAFLPFGCGEEDPSADERAVRAVVHQYVSALARDDFGRACSLLTREGRTGLRQSTIRRGRRFVRSPSCEATAEAFFGSYTPDDVKRFKIRSVKIKGDRAVVTTANTKGTETPLRKVDGRWLVE